MALMLSPVAENVSVDIEFVTDNKKFESSVEELFGHFKLRDDSAVRSQQQQQQLQQHQQSVRSMDRQISLAAMVDVSEILHQ